MSDEMPSAEKDVHPYEPCVLNAEGRCTRWSHDHAAENAAVRQAAIAAVHHLEAGSPDPSVEEYVDAVLSVIPPGTTDN